LSFEAIVTARDGVSLSLSVSLPAGARLDGSQTSVPVILDCHPYRKDDLFSFQGSGLYEYFNERGFATARLDVRGTGRSRGFLPLAEYSHEEIDDCVDVIEWLAGQAWSNGSVGMWGISWSASNTLLVAARRPPALKACIAVHPSDELFASDIHYIDGLLHYDLYDLFIDSLNPLTPGPDFPVDDQLIRERFDQPPWMAAILQHPVNDSHWRSRSLAPRWDRIGCPVFLVGGWYDGYHECVFRLLEKLPVPVQATIGPWAHVLPHMGGPGKPVDWLAQASDWWERWLRPERLPEVEPPGAGDGWRKVQVFTRRWHRPGAQTAVIEGSWKTTDEWPVAERGEQAFVFHEGRLVPRAEAGSETRAEVTIDSPPWIGHEVGHWWGDIADDQAPVDSLSVVFEYEVTGDAIDLLGSAHLELSVVSPGGTHLFARLLDVAPSGEVTLVTGRGVALPATGGHSAPVEIDLHWTSWLFEPSHKIRVALSTSLWPMFWPARRTGPVRLVLGGMTPPLLRLPTAPAAWGRDEGPPTTEGQPIPSLGSVRAQRTWQFELNEYGANLLWATSGSQELDFGRMSVSQQLHYQVAGQPEIEAAVRGEAVISLIRSSGELRWRSTSLLETADETMRFNFRRELIQDDSVVRSADWTYEMPFIKP
jgi:predicted acyl esterase